MTGIAYQYALAVFSLAKDDSRERTFKESLEEFAKSLDKNIYHFFAHPKISKLDKLSLIEKVVKNDSLLMNFLKVLVENDRFDILESIIVSYQEILDDVDKIMSVTLVSNKPLSKDNINKIKTRLNKQYMRSIKIEEKIDPTIIGGFRIEFEGNIIDETINRQLNDIKSSLLE